MGNTILTIGMPSYNNPVEVWATLTALKTYQKLKHTHITVVDNAGNDTVKKIVGTSGFGYKRYTEKRGPQAVRNKIFEIAEGDFVLCIDSHVMLWRDAIENLIQWVENNPLQATNLIQGPMVYGCGERIVLNWKPKWRANMWGIWGDTIKRKDMTITEPYETEIMALGLFGCRKDSWLGFHPDNTGFGGAEGYLHEKYRKAGRTTWMLPWLMWAHNFNGEYSGYAILEDRIANYLRGFKEVGLDTAPIYEHFGQETTERVARSI